MPKMRLRLDPTGGAYSAPQDHQAGFGGPLCGGEGMNEGAGRGP